jgi:hypothetical protein
MTLLIGHNNAIPPRVPAVAAWMVRQPDRPCEDETTLAFNPALMQLNEASRRAISTCPDAVDGLVSGPDCYK